MQLSFHSESIIHFEGKGTPRITRSKALSLVLAAVFALLLFPAALIAQNQQYTKNTPDQTLRSDLRVDPSTLGMSIQIPLAGYPGRAGTSVPFVLSQFEGLAP